MGETSGGEGYWKNVWECSNVLGSYLNTRNIKLEEKIVIELGAGATGIPGIIALKCSAKKVIFVEHPQNSQALELLEKNCSLNNIPITSFRVVGLDWNDIDGINNLIKDLKHLDYILGSDIFYDPVVFEGLVTAIALFLSAFPQAICIFAFEERDSDWSIEDLLYLKKLHCSLVRTVQTDLHTFRIGFIFSKQIYETTSKMFAGIEGGATQSKLVIIDGDGKTLGEWVTSGINICLDGFERSIEKLVSWIRSVKEEINVTAPLRAVAMGMAGAEDEARNEVIVNFLNENYGDIATSFYLTSDSLMSLKTAFDSGVVLIAGTGSTCRLLKKDGTVHGVGGWGHQIGDGGSGFWISVNTIRKIFDHDDGLVESPHSTDLAKKLLLKHFSLDDKIEVLDLLYSKFDKSNIASFTNTLATEGSSDRLIQSIFYDAGKILGSHVRAISRNCDSDMLLNMPVLLVGSLWNSWELLKIGFIEGIRENKLIKCVTLYKLMNSAAVNAAVLAAKNCNYILPVQQISIVFDTIMF
ncbi:unnamed protein product [Dracunculus medinensis]|uniref:N-acetyl-D-glucosamine kinase n=1 Tax=Dracunculus medinensis TaxID=318479 RepID=A0A158Q6E2_DRAME|nr:unnamed protein product [Dracunculus medinensis]